MDAPHSLARIAAEARACGAASRVYAASLAAMDVDTEEERAYLRDLEAALGLDPDEAARLRRA